MMRRWRGVFLGWSMVGWIAAGVATSAAAEPPALAEVLARAGAAVVERQRQLAGIVAEEHYAQDVRTARLSPMASNQAVPVTHRELTSDLLLVRPVGASRWMQFRDVFEVDGKPVRDRSERLEKLFLSPSSSTATQAEMIAEESSRYNIGNVQRTLNVPLLALVILDPAQQQRFTFKRADKGGDPPVRSAAQSMKGVWVVEYREVEAQTIIRTTDFRDMPSRGRFWLNPETGQVLASELIAEDLDVRGIITVGYEVEPALQMMVPVQMQEQYEIFGNRSRVLGAASYARFRQFQVKVDEKIAPIK